MRLDVRYGDHFEAKRLGARWDPVHKFWYAPAGTDLSKLTKFIPGLKITKEVKQLLKEEK